MVFSGPRDYGWGVRVRRPFGARGMSSVRYRTRLGDLKNKQSTESKALCARRRIVEDMCYGIRRA